MENVANFTMFLMYLINTTVFVVAKMAPSEKAANKNCKTKTIYLGPVVFNNYYKQINM